MGGINTKEEIIARLDELDRKELALNLQLRDLQKQLNDIVPDDEKVKINENLGREDMNDVPERTPQKKRSQNLRSNNRSNTNQKRQNKKRFESDEDDEENSDDDDDDDENSDEEEEEEEDNRKRRRRRK